FLIFLSAIFPAFSQTDWPTYGHDPGGLQYSPLTEIDRSNVRNLQIAWTYDTRPAAMAAAEGESPKAPRNPASQVTPVVVGGMMYLATPYGHIIALQPETGKVIWDCNIAAPPAVRGIAYWPGDDTLPPQLVVGTSNVWLLTVNARTGKVTTTFGDNGR